MFQRLLYLNVHQKKKRHKSHARNPFYCDNLQYKSFFKKPHTTFTTTETRVIALKEQKKLEGNTKRIIHSLSAAVKQRAKYYYYDNEKNSNNSHTIIG